MKKFITRMRPRNGAEFVNIAEDLHYMSIAFGELVEIEKDVKVVENHRSAYGCHPFQILELSPLGIRLFEYHNIDLQEYN